MHKASIISGSIVDLGPNGIAFSSACCGDSKTIQRHTIQHAHTMSYEELEMLIQREYLTPQEGKHAATSAHVTKLSGSALIGGNVDPMEGYKGCCGE